MSTVKWMIEKDIFREENPEKMAEIVMKRGMECLRVERIPHSNSIQTLSKDGIPQKRIYSSNMPYPDGDCVIVVGSMNICQQLMEPKRWVPTVWYNLERFRCVSYYAHWGEYLINNAMTMMPWAELRRNKLKVFAELGGDWYNAQVFIKPDANLKLFSGKAVYWKDFEHWADHNQDRYEIPPETLVLVSPVRPLGHEWRFIICDGKVVTGSQYKYAGERKLSPDVPQEAWDYAAKIAAHAWQPEPVYCLDLADVGPTNHGPKEINYHPLILECGPFNGSGLYACDLEKVVDAVSAQALKEWKSQSGTKLV